MDPENLSSYEQEGDAPDLTTTWGRRTLALRIKADIDAACVRLYADKDKRRHLGASLIGHECDRHLYYNFRWFSTKEPDARMLRLWDRGHLAETRYITWLKEAGFILEDRGNDGAGNRLRIARMAAGHFGGTADDRTDVIQRYNLTEPLLLEYKTSQTGAEFNKLSTETVIGAKPQHYHQMNVYGRFLGLKYALYICGNKNDDDLYVDIVELDWEAADKDVKRAEKIIFAQVPPDRIRRTPTYYLCKNLCEYKGVCWDGEQAPRNCRTCALSWPIEDGKWHCQQWNATIPNDVEKVGCPAYTAIRD